MTAESMVLDAYNLVPETSFANVGFSPFSACTRSRIKSADGKFKQDGCISTAGFSEIPSCVMAMMATLAVGSVMIFAIIVLPRRQRARKIFNDQMKDKYQK